MLDGLFAGGLSNLERGLDRTARRQELLMNNLANVNVPGYKRRDMDFAVALDGEMGGDAFESEGSVRVDDSSVDPEQEAAGIAQMELRFSTLSDLTAGYFSGLKNAIREGR